MEENGGKNREKNRPNGVSEGLRFRYGSIFYISPTLFVLVLLCRVV